VKETGSGTESGRAVGTAADAATPRKPQKPAADA
jgi:hypothetical protein